MGHPLEALLTSYFSQQDELGIPSALMMEKPVESAPISFSFEGAPKTNKTTTENPVQVTKIEQPVINKPLVSEALKLAPLSIAKPEAIPVEEKIDLVQQESSQRHSTYSSTPTPEPVVREPEETPAIIPAPIPVKNHDQIRKELAELYFRVKECGGCSLCGSRNKVVFGAGNASADIMIIGEAPGFEEDEKGLPYVGPAGQLLNKMLSAINLDREKETFVSTVTKCRAPGNRAPSPEESKTCVPVLKRQIAIIRPKILLVLGQTAARTVLGQTRSIAQIHGEEFDYHGIPAIVTFDPETLLRNSSQKRPAWVDLQKFQQRYQELINE